MSKIKILVVDDEEKFSQMVKKNLEQTGQYEVLTETKGASAFAVAKKFKPNLIFMDILMPDMDGCNAASQIQKDEATKIIPIVFVTATAQKNDTEVFGGLVDGRPFVAKPVIAKPVKTDQLIKCINDNLGKAREQQPLP